MSDKNLNYILFDEKSKEICREIEEVCENRQTVETDVQLANSKILYKLFLLLLTDNQESQYVTRYISNRNSLPAQLLQIVVNTEDLQSCTYTVEILFKLLMHIEADRTAIKKTLSFPSIFSQLLESVCIVHARFTHLTEYKEVLPELQTKLLRMIIIVYEVKKYKNIMGAVSEDAVNVISHLLTTYYKNKELMIALLPVLKLVISEKNCELLGCKRFYDSLCYIAKLTQKVVSVAQILKLLSRNATALNCMSRNEKIFNLIFEIANYSGKKAVKKRTLMTTLYRLTRSAHGLKILNKTENFNKLLQYFLKNEKPEIFHNRMGTIKAYTILNRCITKIVVPSTQLNMDLHLPENPLRYDDSSLEESEKENDDSDGEVEELDFDSDDEFALESDLELMNLLKSPPECLSKANIFFEELNNNINDSTKLNIFENVFNQNTRMSLIENRVYRYKDINVHAFPDALMLESQAEDHYLDPLINNISVETLAHKIKCARGMCESGFKPRIVYNLDDLYGSPTDVPHPRSFVLNNDFRPKKDVPNVLKFESRFECGNLRSAKQIDSFEYELLIKPDTNSYGGNQWFYFQVTNMIPNVHYTFNIINFLKMNSQFNYGMQPVLFSVKDYSLNLTGWKRSGEKIIYYGNNYTDENSIKQYRTLSFSINFPHAEDYVYLAYHYPYTYTRLMTFLFPFYNYNSSQIYTRLDKLCNTLTSANDVPLLTVTGAWKHPKSLHIPFDRRPVIIITARVHPGESNSSWIMEGMIKFLLDESNKDAMRVRERFIFKIVPMLNPEGVIYGNTRNGLTGVDLNRCWSRPNQITCPEIFHTKKLVEYLKEDLRHPIAAYIDIHGHSRKKYFFFYGCNPLMSWNKKDKKIGDCLETLNLLPQMVQVINPHIRMNFCKYKIQKKRESTARVVMWREFKIQHSYTLECSYCSGDNNQTMDTKILTDIGAGVLNALGIVAEKT